MPSTEPPDWGLTEVVGWFLVAQIGTLLWAALVFGPLSGPLHAGTFTDPTINGMFFSAFVLWFAYGVGPIITTRTRGRGPVRDLRTRVRPLDVPIGLAAGAFLQYPVLTVLYLPILRVVDGDPSAAAEELSGRASSVSAKILLVVLAGVMAPLVEELFFRGFMLRGLLKRFSPWVSVVVQAVVFAAIHFQPLQFPGLLVVGLVSGAVALRTDRLGICWALHGGFNGITLILLLT